MAVFAYTAVDGAEATSRGVLIADTPRQARDLLRAKGLTIQEIVPQSGGSARRLPMIAGRRHAERIVPFISELAMLLGAGIPLLEAIDTIARQYTGSFRASLSLLRDRVASGSSLADAMRQQPALFDELTVSVIEVGEHAGCLEDVLTKLAAFKERSLQFKNRIVTALAYPIFVLLMAISVAVGLMTFVIPRLMEGLADSGRELPLATRIVKGTSDILVGQWWLILGGVILAAVLIGLILRSPKGRMRWHRLQLRIPILGPMIRKQAISRIAVVIATMMRSGIVFIKAIQIAERGSSNLVMRDALRQCEAAVAAGRDISTSLESTGAFPPVVVQVFAIGQQSGRLEEMLDKLGADYDRQVALASDRFTALLEPVLVLMLVGLVGLIALATILPLMEAADVVQ